MIRARVPPSLEGEQLALVPILDLTKHSRSPNSKINITSSGIAFFGGKSKTASLEVTRAIRKGESISVDFGPGKIDSSILLDQGSIDTSNSRAGYSLSLSLDSNDRNVDDKADILELNGFPGSGCRISFRIGEDASEPVGSDMLAFLRLTNLNGQSFHPHSQLISHIALTSSATLLSPLLLWIISHDHDPSILT